MNKKLEPCPFCEGATRITAAAWYGDTRLPGTTEPKTSQADYCPKCGKPLTEKAIRAATEANEPLTLEELRGMNDERVYVRFPFIGMYALVAYHREGDDDYDDEDGENVYLTNNLGGRNTYEEIIGIGGVVYRRPLEGGEG